MNLFPRSLCRLGSVGLVALALCTSASAAQAAPPRKVGLTALAAGPGIEPAIALAVSDALAGVLARRGLDVVTEAQVRALLDHEAQQQLVGCTNDGCLAQIGEALGVDDLLSGSLAKVGTSLLLSLRRVEVKSAHGALADERFKKGTLDDVLDALPRLAATLYSDLPAAVATVPAATGSGGETPPAVPSSPAPSSPAPAATSPARQTSARAAIPLTLDAKVRARLLVFRTAAGGIIAVDPKAGSFEPFFVASPKAPKELYAQRIIGGSREGDDKLDAVFWEPRAKERWQASFSLDKQKATLQCGVKTLALTPVKAAALKGAAFFEPAWQRAVAWALRDDNGRYVVVDVIRDENRPRAHRLFIGKRAALKEQTVTEVVDDSAGLVVFYEGGVLRVTDPVGSLEEGGKKLDLVLLHLEDVVGDVYGALGTYQEPLGTACDEVFSAP